MSASAIGMLMGGFNLLVFGTLVVLGLIFGRRSGGFLASAGLLVLLFGSVVAGMVMSRMPNYHGVALPSILGMLLIAAGVGMNAYRHRMAEERS